ncbi:MAG: CC0125/CC1285 family lipoprotein [Thermoanaerobaculia bacterium]
MIATRNSRFLSFIPLLALVACSSGLRIVDGGLSSTDLGEGRWAVKFDSTSVRSDAEAEANLMVHTARFVIDHGASWFTIHELVVGNETKMKTDTEAWTTPSATSSESGTATSATEETRSSRVTTTREGRYTARANIRLWQERPENAGGELYEASRVLDQYAGMRGKTTTSRITMREQTN